MRIHRIAFVVAVALILAFVQVHSANAADIRVVCSNALKAVFEELAPQFEKASGNKVNVTFGLASGFKQQIDAGTAFDVAILTPAFVDDLIKSGKIAADSRSMLARSGLGIMVRKGAPKPDVRSTDAFKKSLLSAQSIAYAKEGASGVLFTATMDKLKMTETLKPKLKPTNSGEEVNNLVVQGGAQYGILPVSEILAVKGAELGGLFPADVQSYIVMTAGVSSNAKQPAAARELIKFLMAPAALPVLKAKGMERN